MKRVLIIGLLAGLLQADKITDFTDNQTKGCMEYSKQSKKVCECINELNFRQYSPYRLVKSYEYITEADDTNNTQMQESPEYEASIEHINDYNYHSDTVSSKTCKKSKGVVPKDNTAEKRIKEAKSTLKEALTSRRIPNDKANLIVDCFINKANMVYIAQNSLLTDEDIVDIKEAFDTGYMDASNPTYIQYQKQLEATKLYESIDGGGIVMGCMKSVLK